MEIPGVLTASAINVGFKEHNQDLKWYSWLELLNSAPLRCVGIIVNYSNKEDKVKHIMKSNLRVFMVVFKKRSA